MLEKVSTGRYGNFLFLMTANILCLDTCPPSDCVLLCAFLFRVKLENGYHVLAHLYDKILGNNAASC